MELKRVFDEQYVVEHGRVTPRDKRTIAAASLQNPNDPDAGYRQKGQQKLKGYSVNITGTTDRKDAPSLITNVQVEGAAAADNAFYGEAITKSGAATGTHARTVYSDGAYQSTENRVLSASGVFTGIQGRQSRYLLDEGDGDTVRIADMQTVEVHEAKPTKSGALRIPHPGTDPSTSGATSRTNNWSRCMPENSWRTSPSGRRTNGTTSRPPSSNSASTPGTTRPATEASGRTNCGHLPDVHG